MFFTETKKRKLLGRAFIYISLSTILGFWAFICVCATLDNNMDDAGVWFVSIIFVGLAVGAITRASKYSSMYMFATRIESALSHYVSAEGAGRSMITLKALAEKISSTEGKTEKAIDRLFAKGYLTGITYSVGEKLIRISDDTDKTAEDLQFIGVSCPSCGAPCKMRRGYSCQCGTCGNVFKVD